MKNLWCKHAYFLISQYPYMHNQFELIYCLNNSFLKGRKEQSMRQLLYNNNFVEKVILENEEVNYFYKLSSRTVELDYINLPDLKTVDKIQYLISENISLDSIYQTLWEGNTPKRSIKT